MGETTLKGTVMNILTWLKEFNREEIPCPEPSTMRTVMPGGIVGIPEHNKPTSRIDVLKVIEDNVQNEIESIDFEVKNLKLRLIDLYSKRRKYLLILDATKDDGASNQEVID